MKIIKKNKIPKGYKEVGNNVYRNIFKDLRFKRPDRRPSFFMGINVGWTLIECYKSLNEELDDIMFYRSGIEDYDPYKNLVEKFMKWNLSEEIEKEITERLKMLLIRKKEREETQIKKFNKTMKLVRKQK